MLIPVIVAVVLVALNGAAVLVIIRRLDAVAVTTRQLDAATEGLAQATMAMNRCNRLLDETRRAAELSGVQSRVIDMLLRARTLAHHSPSDQVA